MKKITFLLPLIILIWGCKKVNNPIDYDSVELTQYVIDNYSVDAKKLYFNEIINNSSHPNYYKPDLNKKEVENILKLIQMAYNTDSPEVDLIFEYYQIHSYYCYSFNSITLEVKTDKPEIENLANQIIPTGNYNLDDILTTYEFDSVKTAYSYPDFPWLTVFTNESYNLIPIVEEFKNIEPVLDTDFDTMCIGDGNNITLTRDESSATLTFSIGEGDCPAGCIYHKYWEFKISGNKARFVRSYEN